MYKCMCVCVSRLWLWLWLCTVCGFSLAARQGGRRGGAGVYARWVVSHITQIYMIRNIYYIYVNVYMYGCWVRSTFVFGGCWIVYVVTWCVCCIVFFSHTTTRPSRAHINEDIHTHTQHTHTQSKHALIQTPHPIHLHKHTQKINTGPGTMFKTLSHKIPHHTSNYSTSHISTQHNHQHPQYTYNTLKKHPKNQTTGPGNMFKTARDITCPVALRNEEAALRVSNKINIHICIYICVCVSVYMYIYIFFLCLLWSATRRRRCG